jgi:hypothetical protein
MKNASMREITSTFGFAAILRSARTIASGFFVNSTAPASARYSRDRDSANRMIVDTPQVIAMMASAITIAAIAPPPPPLPSRSRSPSVVPPVLHPPWLSSARVSRRSLG